MDDEQFRKNAIHQIKERLIEIKQKVLIISYHAIDKELKESYFDFANISIPRALEHLDDLTSPQLLVFLADLDQLTSEVNHLITN